MIEHLLAERGWTQQVLSIVLGMNRSVVNKLVSGVRTIDAETALALGEVFEVQPERFLDLQTAYDLAKAKILTAPDSARATRAQLFGSLPLAEMAKRGWIRVDDLADVATVESELCRFFDAQSPEDIEVLPHAAKRTNVDGPVTAVQLAWLYRVRQIADDMLVGRYSPAAIRNTISKLSTLLLAPEESRLAPRMLAECGIRFVIVESLTGAKIDGVSFWLNDFAPVIGMTLRFDRVDNFWFVLRHELEHILRGHGRSTIKLDAELEGERAGVGSSLPEDERVANEAAAEFCVPQDQLRRFMERKAPVFADRDILGFSRTLKVHPALVAGQLQHRTGRYDRFRIYQTKIRSFVTPCATVDGWGDVAQVGE